MTIRAGIRGEATVIVNESNMASKLGSGAFAVFSTPALVAHLVMRGAQVTRVAPFRPNLEDLYFAIRDLDRRGVVQETHRERTP